MRKKLLRTAGFVRKDGFEMADGKTVLVIAGPTASGKTALSVEASLKFGGEVVSADSMQIYREMDIGTAKPSAVEQRGIPHHLMGIVSPDQPFSVADWQSAAKCVVTEVLSRGALPVVTGGTGLYVNSLVHNLVFSEAVANPAYRRKLKDMADAEGVEAVHSLLADCDPESAATIHPNNLVRVIRALEVYHETGEPMAVHRMRSRMEPSPWRFILIGLLPERQLLYSRINRRADEMMSAGLPDEVHRLLESGYPGTLQSMQGIGYQELVAHLRGSCSLEAAVEQIRQNTRNYAKRQITWFSRLEGLQWVDPVQTGTDRILERIEQALA